MSRPDAPSTTRRTDRPTALAVVLARAASLLTRERPFGRDGDLVQLFEMDVVLRAAVLGIVRCPAYSLVADDVSLPAAFDRLGPDVLADVLRGLEPDPRAADPEVTAARCTLWLRAISVAAAARWLSNQGEYARPEEAYVAAFARVMQRGGVPCAGIEPAVAAARATPRPDLLGERRAANDPRDAAESRAQPDDRGAAELLRVVARSESLLDAMGLESFTGIEDVAAGEAAAVAEAVLLELAHAAALLGLPVLSPPALVRELTAREVEAVAALAPRHSGAPAAARIGRLAVAHDGLVALRTLTSIPEILDRGVSLVHSGLDFDRVIVLEREHGNPGAARLRAVACRTRQPGPGLRSLVEVPVPAGSALARAFDGLQTLCSTKDDAEVVRSIGSPGFAVAPLRAGSGAFGVVLADHFITRRELRDDDASALGLAAGALGLVLENAALHAEGKTLRALAEKDALTGINNRRTVLEIMRREVDRARRYGKPLAIALADVDHFKSWNDLHGHQVGDMVLQTVAQLISSCSREIDACGRYGGEEFLVILPETSADHAVLYAERLRTVVEAHGIDLAASYAPASLSLSIGVTQLLARGDDADRMIERADAALYAAKEHGRNRVCVEVAATARRTAAPPLARSVLDEL